MKMNANIANVSTNLFRCILLCNLSNALVIAFGLVGRCIGSGDPDGEFGEQGSLCLKLPDMLSILK